MDVVKMEGGGITELRYVGVMGPSQYQTAVPGLVGALVVSGDSSLEGLEPVQTGNLEFDQTYSLVSDK